METSDDKTQDINNIIKDAAKAARIYELILNNINLDKIDVTLVDTKTLNDSDSTKSLEYIIEIGNKKDETQRKINTFTMAIKSMMKLIVCDIQNDIYNLKNLSKLSAFYYFFKFRESNDINEEKYYIKKIDSVVDKILLNKNYYYKILQLLDLFKEQDILGNNKKKKNDAYFQILFNLNENIFCDLINKFMNKKKSSYPQYGIPLPLISFKDKDLDKKMKTINNILYVLQKTESFKTKKRFEYFYTFKSEPELLDEINYLLKNTNKSPIVSFDKIDNEIEEEDINYSLDIIEKQKNDEDIISELNQLLVEGKKKQKLFREKKEKISQKYNKLLDEFNQVNTNYENFLNDFNKKLIELKNKLVECNKTKNKKTSEIDSLKSSLDKKDDTIKGISY